MTLKQKTFSAVRWTTLAMVGKVGFQFLQIVVLARILAAEDFGLMAIVVAVISFAQIFSDMGVSSAIIHRQHITRERLSSLYWLNVVASAALMLAIMGSSQLLARYYHSPRLEPMLVFISLHFLINSLGQQLRVLAEKNMLFSELSKIELSAALLGFIVAVSSAFLGAGVWSLVAGLISSTTLNTMLCWSILARGWRPLLRLHFAEIRDFVRFGGYVMGNNILNALNSNADLFIGGRILGAAALGAYSLPRELSLRLAGVVNPIVTRVGLPVMAKSQLDKEFLKTVYLKTMLVTASVNFPIYIALAVFAPEAVELFFGARWHESAPLLRMLAIWGMFRSIGNPVGSLIFAVGRADLAFKWNLGFMIFILPVVWIGAQYGTYGLACALLLLVLGGQIPNWYILVHPLCGASFSEYFRQFAYPLLCSVLAAIPAYFSVIYLVDVPARLIVGLTVGAISYIALSYRLNRVWVDLIFQLSRRNTGEHS